MMVLDLLEVPDGARVGAGPAKRYQRFPLDPPFTVSRAGVLQLSSMTDAQRWSMVMDDGQPRFIGGDGARLRIEGNLFRVETGGAVTTFRLVTDDTPRLDWQQTLDEAISTVSAGVAPGVAALDVLADVLMERQHALGERLRAMPAPRWSDEDWMGDLRQLEVEARVDFSWARGVATSAVTRMTGGLDRLSAHVLTHLLQHVELVAWTAKPGLGGTTALLDAVLEHRLPWLGTLTVHGLKPSLGDELQRLWKKGRWATQVTKGCRLETPPRTPLWLRTATRADPVPERGYMQVGDGSPLCFVRLSHGTVELTATRETFTLNRVKRTVGRGTLGPWVVALKPGDTFTIDERTYTLDVA